jgi:hypothetical protein
MAAIFERTAQHLVCGQALTRRFHPDTKAHVGVTNMGFSRAPWNALGIKVGAEHQLSRRASPK